MQNFAQREISDWLRDRGLEISQEKTELRHLRDGFDFLGFSIREYTEKQSPKPVLLITPSKDAVQRFQNRLKQEWSNLLGYNADTVMKRLNPILRGWANYYRHVVSSRTFQKMDNYNYWKMRKWMKVTHPKKNENWRKQAYLRMSHKEGIVPRFGNPNTGQFLIRIIETKIERHILIRHGASKDDPDMREYWKKRDKRKSELLPSTTPTHLAKLQNGKCPVCEDTLFYCLVMRNWKYITNNLSRKAAATKPIISH